jgi:CspA family cold shock protein
LWFSAVSIFGLMVNNPSAVVFCWRAEMPEGKIKKLVSDRGFGFLEGEREELFFHHSEVQGVTFEELQEGQTLEYEVGQGKKGPCATNVRLAVQSA